MAMSRSRLSRSFASRVALTLVVVAAAMVTSPRSAEAFPGRCGWGGGWPGGWGGFGCGVPCWPMIGSVSYGTGFAFGGTRFWSGTTVLGVPAWGGFGACGPAFCGPVWGGPAWCGPVWGNPMWCGGGWGNAAWGNPAWCGGWGGGWGGPVWGGWYGRRGGVGAWYGSWNPGPAWGWNRGPAWGWNPGPARGWAIPFAHAAPVQGHFARPPFQRGRGQAGAAAFGLAGLAGQRSTSGTLVVRRVDSPPVAEVAAAGDGRGRLGMPAIDAAVEVAIRTSNAPARARAARLVALGDKHLRTAIDDPAKLAKAIDAYRRAGSIAPDQPDTFLRQAIALTAAGKDSAAATAVSRAMAIDSRLADRGAADRFGIGLPAGRKPADATPLMARTGKLLAKIFADPAGAPDVAADNWIATRWLGRDATPLMVAARP